MEKTSEKIDNGTKDILELECPNCGGTIQYNQSERKGVCPYCNCEVMILYDEDKDRYRLVPYVEKEVTVTRYVDTTADENSDEDKNAKKGSLVLYFFILLVGIVCFFAVRSSSTDNTSNSAIDSSYESVFHYLNEFEQRRKQTLQDAYDQITQALCLQNYADIEQGKGQLNQYCDLSITEFVDSDENAYDTEYAYNTYDISQEVNKYGGSIKKYQVSYRKASENDVQSLTVIMPYQETFTDLLQHFTGLTSLTLSDGTADCSELTDQIKHLTKFAYNGTLYTDVYQAISESTISDLSIFEPSADDLNTMALDPNLTFLSINGYSENSLTFLENMTQLQSFTMTSSSLKGDLENLTKLPELQTLNLSSCTFTDVLFPEDFPCLATLILEENEMVSFDLEKIASIATLQKLSLRGSTVNTSQIARMASPSITELDLIGTSAADLSFVPNMPALTTLHFTETESMDTSVLDSYPNLVVEKGIIENNGSYEPEKNPDNG